MRLIDADEAVKRAERYGAGGNWSTRSVVLLLESMPTVDGGEQMVNDFPTRLRRLRERRRMDRKALGECCGLSKAAISKYERGEREPSASSLVKIADFFEVTTDFLLGRDKNF